LRVLKARKDKLTEEYFSHITNCIVFSQKGNRPRTAEISGSDLDGDLYFASWDPDLIPPKVDKPFKYDQDKPKTWETEVKMDDIADFMIDFMNNDILGRIDNSHLAFAD